MSKNRFFKIAGFLSAVVGMTVSGALLLMGNASAPFNEPDSEVSTYSTIPDWENGEMIDGALWSYEGSICTTPAPNDPNNEHESFLNTELYPYGHLKNCPNCGEEDSFYPQLTTYHVTLILRPVHPCQYEYQHQGARGTACSGSVFIHNGEEYTIEPTCTTAGETGVRCKDCGETTVFEEIPALEHDWMDVSAGSTPATCTEKGYQRLECSRCMELGGQSIPALGHDWGEYVETAAPTCTEAGTEKASCSRCDVIDERVVSALGHDLEEHSAKIPTCTAVGWNAYESCSRCDYITYEEIAATGHTPGAAATCTTAQVCLTCGAELSSAKGHKPGTPATCTTPQTCTVCGTQLVSALGHDVDSHPAKSPSCSENGWYPYVTCSRCDYTTYRDIPAYGHTAGGAATCITPQICTVCGEVIVEALGHDEIRHEAKEPTCTEKGWEAYVTCSRCNYITYKELAATGHKPGPAATCTDAQTCLNCEMVLKSALGHNELWHEAKEPSCMDFGWKAYVTCSRCDYTTYAEIAATGHTPGLPATCTDAQTCTICGDVLVEALGHVPGDKATCSSSQTCLRCSAELAPALGHDLEYHASKEASESESGNIEYWTCALCGCYFADESGKSEISSEDIVISPLSDDGMTWWQITLAVAAGVILLGGIWLLIDKFVVKKGSRSSSRRTQIEKRR